MEKNSRLVLLGWAGLLIFGLVVALWALPFAPEPIGSRSALFVEGTKATLALTLVSGVVGLLLGLAAALARIQRSVFWSVPAGFYIWLMRGTPLLVQILFVYFALPALSPVFRFDEFTAAVVALALNVGAYNAETIRAGILAVPKAQVEAAASLGLSPVATNRWVVLPQALKIVTPPLVNNGVALLKDSALASSIGLLELTLAGNRISSETFRPVPTLVAVACIYLVLTTAISGATRLLETRSHS